MAKKPKKKIYCPECGKILFYDIIGGEKLGEDYSAITILHCKSCEYRYIPDPCEHCLGPENGVCEERYSDDCDAYQFHIYQDEIYESIKQERIR